MRTITTSLLVTTALVTLGACGSTQPAQQSAEMHADDTAAMEALYWERRQEQKMNFTQADVDFMTGMIGHHAQALIMSDLAPKNDASPAVQRLAARIINAQRDEIATMQKWLRDRGQPVPAVEVDGLMLMITMEEPAEEGTMESGMMGENEGHGGMDHSEAEEGEMDHGGMDHDAMGHGGMHDHSSMPGMLSQAQLEELAAARGAEFDRLFLTYMIQHHGGAITMVDDLLAVDGAAQDDAAFKLASEINVDQKTEIERMNLMLRQMER